MLRRLYCSEADDPNVTRGAGDAYMSEFVTQMGFFEFIRFVWQHRRIVTGGFSARKGMGGVGLAAGERVPDLVARDGETHAPVTLASLMTSGRPVVLSRSPRGT